MYPLSASDGFGSIYKEEGMKGLYRGTSLALVGVSNGALQFTGYEKMKAWGFAQKRKRFAAQGREVRPEDDKLVSIVLCSFNGPILISTHIQSNTSYTVMSGASKLFALAVTYPYQVVRSRIQVRVLRRASRSPLFLITKLE